MILKEVDPEYSLEGLMLKLRLQSFGHLIGRADSLGKTLMLEKTEGRRRRGWHHQLNRPESEEDPGDDEGQGSLTGCSLWGCRGLDTT